MACLSGICNSSSGISKWKAPYCIDPYEYVATTSREINSNQKLCRHGDEFIIMNSDGGIDYKGTWNKGKEKGEQYSKDGSVSYKGKWQHDVKTEGDYVKIRKYIYNRQEYPYLEDKYTSEGGDFIKGAFSDNVFKVKNKIENKTYFAKQTSTEIKMLHEEFKKLNKVKTCPHIIHVKDFFMSEDKDKKTPIATLITELAQGGDLFEFIATKKKQEQKINVTTLSNFMYQLINGLECAHKKNIYHLDIKPANIVFSENPYMHPNPQLFYIDFGISVEDSKDKCTQISGTKGYLAPEIKKYEEEGKYYKCSLADIFSLGMVFIHLYSITDDDPIYLKNKKDIEQVISYMLAEDVAERWTLDIIKQSNWYKWHESLIESPIELDFEEKKEGKSKRKYKKIKKYSKRKC